MSRWNAYLNNLEEITGKYDGAMPLSHWLKAYFRERKKMGSTDRKIVSSITYQYYRSFHALSGLPFRDHVLAARLLCTDHPDPLLAALHPLWNDVVTLSTDQKEALIRQAFPSVILKNAPASISFSNQTKDPDFVQLSPAPKDGREQSKLKHAKNTKVDLGAGKATESELNQNLKKEADSNVDITWLPTQGASVEVNEDEQKNNLHAAGPEAASGNSFNYFPFVSSLSAGIDHIAFARSFLVQPDLFLRLRPGHQVAVRNKLFKAGISFQEHGEDCISLANQSQLDAIIRPDEEAVIQDYNSQRVGDFFDLKRTGMPLKVWDCCAASGGKSVMAFDQNPRIELTVSDLRKTILENLANRFRAAGISKYQAFKADLANGPATFPGRGELAGKGRLAEEKYDLIIADLPCSGSGTWSRTPEQLAFFEAGKIKYYSDLQKSILRNVVPALKINGRLVYITCSVFEAENEAVAAFAKSALELELLESKLLKGYQMKADSLFVAVFRRISR